LRNSGDGIAVNSDVAKVDVSVSEDFTCNERKVKFKKFCGEKSIIINMQHFVVNHNLPTSGVLKLELLQPLMV